jgi:hypothetical protein
MGRERGRKREKENESEMQRAGEKGIGDANRRKMEK